MRRHPSLYLCLLLGAVSLACPQVNTADATRDAGSPDVAGSSDSGSSDAATRDATRGDTGDTDGRCQPEIVDAGSYVDERGFTIRTPQQRTIMVYDEPDSYCELAIDRDYMCYLSYQNIDTLFYIQNTPLAIYWQPWRMEFSVEGAWIKNGQEVVAVPASFEVGGHGFIVMRLEFGGHAFEYGHSSYGFGYRPCMPPDCIRVYTPGFGQLIEDGCADGRPLPSMCFSIEMDGTVPPLQDDYELCPGDPRLDAG